MATMPAQQQQQHQCNNGNASVLDEQGNDILCDILPVIFGGCGI
jgi:hypothetical protein